MESLFSMFPAVSLAEWKAKLAEGTKGTFEELSTCDDNGIKIAPFYNLENQLGELGNLFANPDWEICTAINETDPQKANKKALAALDGGASGILFDCTHDAEGDLKTRLERINCQYIYTCFKIAENPNQFLRRFSNYLKSQGLAFPDLNCCIEYDPISNALKTGDTESCLSIPYLDFVEASSDLTNITVDTTVYQNAGANTITQLGLGLAHLNEYLFWLAEKNSLSLVRKINIKVAVGTSFFEEIAKLRALRKLLSNLFKTYSIQPEVIFSAETSNIYRAPLDTYNNILRDSIAAMAAVIGGCDSLTIHDFDEFSKKENARFSDRIARNQQLILKEESHFNKVADIGSGSFYLETLTTELSVTAWSYFQEIMEEGGILSYAEKGILKEKIAKQAEQLIAAYKNGKRTLIGINKFREQTGTPDLSAFSKSDRYPAGLQAINLAYEILNK